jgi:regulator of sigma E protease
VNLLNVAAFLLLLGTLIFIHELGHFLMAKLFGVRVLVFSLGFGPRVLGWQRGHTDYRISAIPLGGYVKMWGENPEDALSGSREEFLSRSKPVRFTILVMGAVMNLLLAMGIYWGMFMSGMEDYAYRFDRAVVGSVRDGSPAADAGILPGDTILALGGKDVPDWDTYVTTVRLNPNTDMDLRLLRDGREMVIPVRIGIPPHDDPLERYRMGYLGIGENVPILFQEVEEGGPAEQAGVQPGDKVLSLNGERLFGVPSEVADRIKERIGGNAGVPVTFLMERDRSEVTVIITPGEKDGAGWIGVAMGVETELVRYGPGRALVASVQRCRREAGLLFASLRKLVTMKLSFRSMSGPIDIYQFSAQAARAGAQVYLGLMAFISLNLGIFNLLPIPVLDGGHIFVLLIEGVLRRDLSMQVKERIMVVGFVFLVTLMGLVISFDLMKHFEQ